MTLYNCYACKAGWHAECIAPEKEETANAKLRNFTCCCYLDEGSVRESSPTGTFVQPPIDTRRAQKADDDIKDVTSTGRKRAAILFPIPSYEDGGMVCEWAWLSLAGGGTQPVIGCRGNLISDIKDRIFEEDGVTVKCYPGNVHHGPDKSTIRNEPGNVHRICPVCHNRWHALNDPFYGRVRPEQGASWFPLSGDYLTHNKEIAATEAELDWSDKYWGMSNKQRESVIYRLPKE